MIGPAKALATLVAAATVAGGGTLKVGLTAAGHAPKVNTHWAYTVKATSSGKAAKGTVTAQIVDPLGGKHPVGFGAKKGNVTRVKFTGTFHDFVVWPKTSLGVPLTFRVTVVSGPTTRVVNYKVTPRS